MKGQVVKKKYTCPNSRELHKQFLPVAHQKLRYEQVWREPREVILLVGVY